MKILLLSIFVPFGLGFLSCRPSKGPLTTGTRSKDRKGFSSTRQQGAPSQDVLLRWAQQFSWSSEDGMLKLNGNPLNLKGVNYFGFEDEGRHPQKLDKISLDIILGFLKKHNFNAVRLPISLSMALDLQNRPSSYNALVDSDLKQSNGGKPLNGGELLIKVIDKCASYGLLVMPDIHRCDEKSETPDKFLDAGQLEKGWLEILKLVGDKWNVFAIDLKNEPHEEDNVGSTWGTGDPNTDWRLEAQYLANQLIGKAPHFKGLIFVEGVSRYGQTYTNWGGNLRGVQNAPLDLGNPVRNKRLVYSPHVYGPCVPPFGRANLQPQVWHEDWGFVKGQTDRAVVLGEWGGWCGNWPPNGFKVPNNDPNNVKLDETWHQALAKYLGSNGMASNFYWCLNPESKDTGGLLDQDWSTPIQNKLDILDKLVPNPTKFTS